MNTKTDIFPKFNDLRILISTSKLNSPDIYDSVLNYEKFFYLIKKYPGVKLVPTKRIDKIWHFHLASFELYKKDSVFTTGYVVGHKQPKTKIELDHNKRKYAFTSRLWRSTFHSEYGNWQDMAFCGVDGDGVDGAGDNGGDKGEIGSDD